jgi:RimJ/RimL family protein N-acetyltransferase
VTGREKRVLARAAIIASVALVIHLCFLATHATQQMPTHLREMKSGGSEDDRGPIVLLLYLGGIWALRAFGQPIPRRHQIMTRRLVLRRARPTDLVPLHAIYSDEEALRYWDNPAHASLVETEQWFGGFLARDGDSNDFIIERSGLVIGVIHANLPWIGFILARGEWRKGYGTEALSAITGYAFDRGFSMVFSVTDQQNAAALALLRKAGFEEMLRGTDRHEALNREFDFVAFKLARPTLWRRLAGYFDKRSRSVKKRV